MSPYVRGTAIQASENTILTVHQIRQRNAAIALEMRHLTAEQAEIERQAATMRKQVTTARKRLTKQAEHLDAARAQTDLIAAAKAHVSTLPPPIHGGRAGLEAAAREAAGLDKRTKQMIAAGIDTEWTREYKRGRGITQHSPKE